jgi:hypothetical protein
MLGQPYLAGIPRVHRSGDFGSAVSLCKDNVAMDHPKCDAESVTCEISTSRRAATYTL